MNSESFLEVIESTPLVSIDIILKNLSGEYLLGKRTNRPAQGFWFVPGGRIRKNETLQAAMSRISLTELGIEILIEHCNLIGAFDHIYTDNFQGKSGINTHYVALGYNVDLPANQPLHFDSQHSEVRWWPRSQLLESNLVHENTKAYFNNKV